MLARSFILAAALFALVLPAGGLAAQQAPDARLAAGSGHFLFPFRAARDTRWIVVWYHRPEAAGAEAPVVFVMHGTSRTGENYRRQWAGHAERHRFVLLVPEFSRDQFPGRSYNLGGVFDRDGARRPETEWTYSAIEDIFDAVRAANGLSTGTYDIYGHSAGGQFVHRMVLLKPSARFRVAIAANSGWYLMPDFRIGYPHGLAGAGIGREEAARALGRRLVVLLGGDDNDPEHYQLDRAPASMVQGADRLERGQNFHAQAARTAAELGAPLAWSMRVAPGVAHSNAGMAAFAAPILAGQERP